MSFMVINGSEMIRSNPPTSSIEASCSRGFSWSMRCRYSDMGNVRALTLHKGEITLCSDQGIYASKKDYPHVADRCLCYHVLSQSLSDKHVLPQK